MKHYIFLLLGVMLLGSSCSLLETEPMDTHTPEDFYSTQEEVEFALNGVYAVMANTQLYGGEMLARMGLTADIGYESYSSDYNTVGDYDTQPSDPKVQKYWRYFYEGINRANMLMERIDQAKLEKETRDNIYAQAQFLRGFYHFMLLIRFRNIPLMLHTAPDGNVESVQIAQADPRDAYLAVIADMEAAAEHLGTAESLEAPGRVSQSTAWGMLARVALNMAGYPLYEPGMYAKAKGYAQKVIDTQYHALHPSYEELFLCYIQDRYYPQESLFEVEFYGNNEGTYDTTAGRVGRDNGIGNNSADNRTVILPNGMTLIDTYGTSIGAIRATPYYLSLFESDDLRRDWTVAPYEYTVAYETYPDYKKPAANTWCHYCGKFRREYEVLRPRSTNYTPINFPVLRYSDVLLMWAEAVVADVTNNSAEDLAQAREYINQVRRRGYGKDILTPDETVDLPSMSKSELFEELKDERARELGYELLRKDDIVRWGEFTIRMKYMKGLAGTIPETYTSSYYINARRYYSNAEARDELWPIPTFEMGVNRKLVQNTGW